MTRLLSGKYENHEPTSLPAATRDRWQPIRGGLLNLYLFDHEEFRYEKGHLLLRGNNGTGKSRVMALQLPFLLDGHLASSRVEPDADPAKKMEWNLLMGRHGERLGYTWIEFGRLVRPEGEGAEHDNYPRASSNGENGHLIARGDVPQFVTLGCGLSATRGSGMRDPWFFITDQRIGEELFLKSPTGHPLSKSGLTEALGGRGTVYATAKDYRHAVDERLFGLGRRRYEAMVDLLIQLRKPQLSRHLDEKTLARVLAEALPPPSEQIISDVAESFRGLETDRTELDRFRSTRDGVNNFLKTYQRYSQTASRRRAMEVRQSHSRYEYASRALREAEQASVEAVQQLEKTKEQLAALEIKDEEHVAQIEALHADPKMRSADAISEAAKYVQQALDDLQSAQRDFSTSSIRCEQRQATRSEALLRAKSQLKDTSEILHQSAVVAADCDWKSQHDDAFSGLRLQVEAVEIDSGIDPRLLRRQVEEASERRVRACEKLKKSNAALTDSEAQLAQAIVNQGDAQRRVDQTIEDQRLAEQKRRGAVDDLLESYRMWCRDSDELTLPSDDEISADLDDWSQRVGEASPISIVLRNAEINARQTQMEKRARLQHQADALEVEQADAEKLAEKMKQGFHEPPPNPFHADESARAARPGAPFWSLVDFTQSRPSAERANIEAALEAAGFLNAWVLPEGSVLTADFSDVLLSAGDWPDVGADRSLLEALMPDKRRAEPSRDVSDAVIERLLRKIGYDEQNSHTWFSADGRWRHGLLHGSCHRESAQYIGHDAREEHRTRSLAAVQVVLQGIEERATELEVRRQYIEDRFAAIAKQVEAVPNDSEIRAAANSAAIAMQKMIEQRKALTEAERIVADSQAKMSSIRENRDRDAQDLGLTGWVDRLDELVQRIGIYRRLLAELWPSIDHFESLRTQNETAVAAANEAENDASLRRDDLHNKRIRHAKEDQRLNTLRETVGAEAAEIQRQLADAKESRRLLQASIKQTRQDQTDAAKVLAGIEERITSRRDIIGKETQLRQESCAAFQRLCELGLLVTATGESHDVAPLGWSVSRTVEVARQTESLFSQVSIEDAAWDRVQQAVTTTFQDLNTALSQQAFTSTLSTVDGLYRVMVPYQGRDRSVYELRDLLAEEVRQRQLILDEREREIIEKHLIGEVASKLHEQIHEAHALVAQMNAEIQKRPMSTGMMLKFDWKPDEELSNGIVEMCEKLLATTGTWSPAERTAVGRYLQNTSSP